MKFRYCFFLLFTRPCLQDVRTEVSTASCVDWLMAALLWLLFQPSVRPFFEIQIIFGAFTIRFSTPNTFLFFYIWLNDTEQCLISGHAYRHWRKVIAIWPFHGWQIKLEKKKGDLQNWTQSGGVRAFWLSTRRQSFGELCEGKGHVPLFMSFLRTNKQNKTKKGGNGWSPAPPTSYYSSTALQEKYFQLILIIRLPLQRPWTRSSNKPEAKGEASAADCSAASGHEWIHWKNHDCQHKHIAVLTNHLVALLYLNALTPTCVCASGC